MVKKLSKMMVSVLLAACLTGCASKSEEVAPIQIKHFLNDESTTESSVDGSEPSSGIKKHVSEDESTSSDQLSQESVVTPTATPVPKCTIDETLIWDQDDVKITSKKFDYISKKVAYLTLYIENNSDREIMVNTQKCIINDIAMCPVSVYQNIHSGKAANVKIEIDAAYLISGGIENIGDIKINFEVQDKDYNHLFYTDNLDIPTSYYNEMDTDINLEGAQELYTGSIVNVYGLYTGDFGRYNKKGVLLFIENLSGTSFFINCSSASVNGLMMEYAYIENREIYEEKDAIAFIQIDDTFIKENAISEISEVAFNLEIIEQGTYSTLDSTGMLTVRNESATDNTEV